MRVIVIAEIVKGALISVSGVGCELSWMLMCAFGVRFLSVVEGYMVHRIDGYVVLETLLNCL